MMCMRTKSVILLLLHFIHSQLDTPLPEYCTSFGKAVITEKPPVLS